jgi:hypothetical protein
MIRIGLLRLKSAACLMAALLALTALDFVGKSNVRLSMSLRRTGAWFGLQYLKTLGRPENHKPRWPSLES